MGARSVSADLREAQLELAKGSASTALVSAMQLQVMGGARLNATLAGAALRAPLWRSRLRHYAR